MQEVPGADFIEVKPPKHCRSCGAEILLALVRHPDKSIKWHNFDRIPRESGGLRYYSRHVHRR